MTFFSEEIVITRCSRWSPWQPLYICDYSKFPIYRSTASHRKYKD